MSDKLYTVSLTAGQLTAIGILAGARALELHNQPVKLLNPNIRDAYNEYVSLVELADKFINTVDAGPYTYCATADFDNEVLASLGLEEYTIINASGVGIEKIKGRANLERRLNELNG